MGVPMTTLHRVQRSLTLDSPRETSKQSGCLIDLGDDVTEMQRVQGQEL